MNTLCVDAYLSKVSDSLHGQEQQIEDLASMIYAKKKKNQRVWILGNGGSLAVAQHFAQDLLKTFGIRAQCANDPSVLTAYTNDCGFENVFESVYKVLADFDDLVIVFSCSGKSRNYTKLFGAEYCEVLNLFAVVGTDGKGISEGARNFIHINSQDYKVCETAFQVVCDLVMEELETKCQK